ncbi:MAG: hypothetical protein QXQ64_09915 [Candidatus Bathyarchaeia archaeon]
MSFDLYLSIKRMPKSDVECFPFIVECDEPTAMRIFEGVVGNV